MRTRASKVALLVSILTLCPAVHAADKSGDKATAADAAPTDAAVAEAADHFQRARALYQNGSYREAIDELERAHKLDPTAKDLVYNLSLVSEKLGRLDDALVYMRSYEEMDLTPPERARADAAIHRLEGARRETPPAKPATDTPAPPPPPPPERPPSEQHGRIDALTIGAAAVAVTGFTVGTIFAVKANSDKPSPGTVTQGPGSYDSLQQKANDAHKEAVIADIGFAVGIVATVGTAVLYFARTKPSSAPARGTLRVAPAVAARGGGVVIGGTF